MPRTKLKAPDVLILIGATCLAVPPGARGCGEPPAFLYDALEAVCEAPASSLDTMATDIPGAAPLSEVPLSERNPALGWERRFRLPDRAEIAVQHLAPGGRLQQVLVEYHAATREGGTHPRLALVAGPDCRARFGRRLLYDDGLPAPTAVEHLDGTLSPTGVREPLNPPVPDGDDPGGVAVALVDSGVNYLLPELARRLARDEDDRILGYDYWDLDERPFDANPAQSPFFPQRHGTKTATLLLAEAPGARLVPYRYPRPDMTRMTALIDDAADKGVRIVNLSMGSNDREEWQAFADAARRHPRMLFVLSAGNNGRNLDDDPVFPAALPLDNAITVTSAEDDGELAPGSNWGRRSVDLMVPAERLAVTGFEGDEVPASGSSYAAVRVTALAARLLATHPQWSSAQLKSAILSRVLPNFSGRPLPVAAGFMPRPGKAEALPAWSNGGPASQTARHVLGPDDLGDQRDWSRDAGHGLKLTFVYFEDTAWRLDDLERAARGAASILAQCGIRITRIDVRLLDGPAVFRYFHDDIAKALVRRLPLPKPAVYFVRDTLQVYPYDAEAIGKSNSGDRPELRDTVWVAEGTRHPPIAVAHELAHLLMDSGRHVERAGNLMREDSAPQNTTLDDGQCEAMVRTGRENGLLGESGG